MPGINGIEFHRRIKTLLPALPVIFVTAHHDEEAHQNALDRGAFGFFYKPFDGEELLNTIDAALRWGRT